MQQDLTNDKFYDTEVSFEQLHEYVRKYRISNTNGPLQIFDRETSLEYIPKTDEEKRNIEFAFYWLTKAGIDEDKDDVVFGEKAAFSDDAKKLFDLLDVQFKESIKRGIDVDLESLKKQFHSSEVKNADRIYERLFENKYYLQYVIEYYKNSLGISKSDTANLKDLADVVESVPKQAEELQKNNENIEIKNDALNLAKEIINEKEKKLIEESAKVEAKNIEVRKQYDEILSSAKEEARNINEKNKKADLMNGAEEQAREIINKAEQKEIRDSALDEALRINNEELLDLALNGARDQALELVDKEEKEKLRKDAVVQALEIVDKAEKEEIMSDAEKQAKLLVDKENFDDLTNNDQEEKDNESLFEIVEEEQEEVKDPVLAEIEDAFEVVESYASADQPTSIKIFFDKEDLDDNAEVVISNGVGVDETVMYQRTFDTSKLTKDIMPYLCKLYAQNNEVTYNKAFDVPNTTKAELVVIGTDEKVFQVSNAEKAFVQKCQTTLNSELYKNTSEEKGISR